MKLSELKNFLTHVEQVNIELPNGKWVPSHFHITEMGLISKHFIDCGGTVRQEKKVSMQVWTASDLDHRLEPKKLLKIISIAEGNFGENDLEIEIEYQAETIGKYAVEVKDQHVKLVPMFTNCLASDQCGITPQKEKLPLLELQAAKEVCCSPGGGCC